MFHILVVDDDKNTRRLIEAVLSRENYTVTTAENGEQALQRLDEQHIDLIVLDIMMPKIDGYELTRQLRAAGNELPILMVSAKQLPADRHRGFLVGTDDYVTKPIDEQELLRQLVNTHIAPSSLCRAAYTERALKAAVHTGVQQYVILGAGLDTFAFRERKFLSEHPVFEVDHPATQADKAARIARAGWTIPGNLTFVPVDFARDNLAECLLANGFEPSVRSFFSWLGVTYYLPAEAINNTLASLSALCLEDSALVFDYPDEGFFTAAERRVQNTIGMAKAGGEPMQSAFSYAELERMLERNGFRICELLTPADIQTEIIDRAGAELKAFEHVNYCLAVRTG